MTDLLVIDLQDAAQAWQRAADGPSADAEHDAGRMLADAALAVCDAYDSMPGPVTVSDAAALGALVRAAWAHQLVAWIDRDNPAGFTWAPCGVSATSTATRPTMSRTSGTASCA